MKKINVKVFSLSSIVLVSLLAACDTNRVDIVDSDKQYSAYGKTWRYQSIEHHSQGWELFTGHGYIGLVDRIRQEVFLETIGEERIPVHDRIYALQKDGSYKKINCCNNFGTLASVYEVGNRLFVFLSLGRSITDCFVYPAGQPDNEELPPGEQISVIDFFGEFDPVQGTFYVNSFYKGGIDRKTLYGNVPNWKEIESKESLGAYRTRIYLHRSPFECDKPTR